MERPMQKANPEKWLELYGNLMYQYCLLRVKDKEVSQDLVQETFLAGLKGLSGYNGVASEKNWLFAILKNKLIDHYRKSAKEDTFFQNSDVQSDEDDWFNKDGGWDENKKPANWHSIDSTLEKKEFQKIILICKNHLKDIQRSVFTLKYLEDMDSVEICKVLNISSSNYWVIIHRARLQMRNCVEKNWLNN